MNKLLLLVFFLACYSFTDELGGVNCDKSDDDLVKRGKSTKELETELELAGLRAKQYHSNTTLFLLTPRTKKGFSTKFLSRWIERFEVLELIGQLLFLRIRNKTLKQTTRT